MAESQNTFFLVNIGAQSSQGVTSTQGRAGSVTSAGNGESGSGAAFSRVLAGQLGHGDGYVDPGLQKAIQELARILEGSSASGPPGVVLASNTLAARQSLPVSGNFLPEHTLQRINQLLGAISESGTVLPEQTRLRLQQGLQQLLNGSESGLRLPEQISQRLQHLLESSAESSPGLTKIQSVAARQVQQIQPDSSETDLDIKETLPEKAREQLQQLLDLPAESKLALPEQARQRLQQLLDRSVDTDLSDNLQGTVPEQALQQLRLLLERPPGTGSDLSEGLPENARQHLQKLLDIIDKAEVASLANPLTEAIRSIVQEIKVVVPAGKAGDTAAASIVADVMKSSRLMNLESDSGARNGPVSVRMLALRAAHPASSATSDNAGATGNFDKEILQFARTGFNLQSQTSSRLVAMNSVSDKIIEQVSVKGLSLSPMQTANSQSAEARDISSLLLPVSNVSPRVSADSQLFSPQARLEMQQSLQHSEWGRELGSRVVWMTKQQVQTANIRINPPHLGPLEVRVEVKNDTANVSFISQHVAVRDVIESSIPRLREMLGENGLNLENVDVADQSSAREQQRQANAAIIFWKYICTDL